MGIWYLHPLRKKSETGRGYWHVVRSLHHFPHFPHRWRDLMSYKLLILHTHRQFTGQVWLAYDKSFRGHAAATKLIDWSSMNVQLYNFCTTGASVRGGPDGLFSDLPEPFGATSSQIICQLWNRGRCSCRFAHRCSNCGGPHCAHSCSVCAETSVKIDCTRRLPSPSVSSSSTKSRRH